MANRRLRKQKALDEAESILGRDRLVDFGVRLHVVRQDVGAGRVVIPGSAPVVSLRCHELGGMVDVRLRQFVGPSEQPQVWYCSEQAEQLVLHDTPQPNLLAYGAMGAGKSSHLGLWLLLRTIELTGFNSEVGGTAPTEKRLTMLEAAIKQFAPPNWYEYFVKDKLFLFRNGVRLRLVTTAQRSAEQGSPIQGWNWSACGSDEIQDSLAVDSDIEARGRAAPIVFGYRRCATATAKDNAEWRNQRDKWRSSPNWNELHLEGRSNPFILPSWWERLEHEMSPREYRRKVLAQDVGPERATYPEWVRDRNLCKLPQLGVRDITKQVTGGFAALLGHDPGSLQDVTLVLKCLERRTKGKAERLWWVIDEITTEHTTTEQHVAEVARRLRDTWRLQLPGPDEDKVLVRCDPQGDSANKTDRSVYLTWKQGGFKIMSAAYTAKGQPTGRVPKDAGIEMVNRLLCNAAKESRLFIDVDDRGQPVAKQLVRALEMSERDEKGEAEVKVKGKEDLSHWPASLRYALWPYERIRGQHGVTIGGAIL